MWDVAIIGAGLSGIICARRLVSAGYSVCILDKSRGLGGRMATRRVSDRIRVDHGLRYWQPKSEGLLALTEELLTAGVLTPWAASEYEIQQVETLTRLEPDSAPKYVAKTGISAVAKYLLQGSGPNGLPAFEPERNLLTGHRAISLGHQDGCWEIKGERGEVVKAKRCAIAIPAPQAAELLTSCLTNASSESISSASIESESIESSLKNSLEALKSVSYFPCLTVMAGYKAQRSSQMGELDPNGWMITDSIGTSTDWVGLDSSKRSHTVESTGPVIVIHSKPKFAHRYLETSDLQPAASVLLRANARKLADWIAQPDWFQIHRWRYAQVQAPYREAALTVSDSLICGGDWCAGLTAASDFTNIDYAYSSGRALADHLQK